MIAKKTVIQDIKLADFPEEIDEQNNIKVYGETSWENQLAVLSHYLHNNDCIESKESKREVIYAIREFLEQKKESKKEEIREQTVCGRIFCDFGHIFIRYFFFLALFFLILKNQNSLSSTYLPEWEVSA